MARVALKRGREKPVLNRHPWIFSGAIKRIEGEVADGEVVGVADPNVHSAKCPPHSHSPPAGPGNAYCLGIRLKDSTPRLYSVSPDASACMTQMQCVVPTKA